jgi:glycosyltransferase involved in cell wall biosynthesis
MRILYFSRDYSTHDHRFLSALAKTEHKVYYLRLERRGHTLEDRPLPPEIEQVAWKGGQAPATLSRGLALLADLTQVIQRIQADLIHAGPIQRSAFLVALSGFKPLVSMSWGYDLIQDAKRSPFWRWATGYTLKRSATLVGDSEIVRELAIQYGMDPEHIVTFPWGVDIQHFDLPAKEHSDVETFTLLSTRGWEPIYGVDSIARAFVCAARQLSENHGPRLRLLMLGNGSQAGLLRRIFQGGGVQEQVLMPGQIGQADLPRYYHMADLYLSASHSDGTSISLLEALACGLPALVSDIPGNREWITPGETGWWFSNGDDTALTQAILDAVARRDQLSEMGRRARWLAELRADWSKNFLELEKAYRLAVSC